MGEPPLPVVLRGAGFANTLLVCLSEVSCWCQPARLAFVHPDKSVLSNTAFAGCAGSVCPLLEKDSGQEFRHCPQMGFSVSALQALCRAP